ncbi:nesprin-2-like isoform X4 [Thunnus albacares]|uniref:nesprin-2-like isoform X4 n=1 Tax=Thunnus albacares TaxID=8236 RepID=UPI001CF662F1|nr:nesprin-2-like isoform X4 [Thunnus albacares]
MASGGAEDDDGGIPLDIDNVHMLLQVEQEQIQKRTFTNWINAQLSKRTPPSFVSDLFSDLRDGSRLLDLLEVMSSQRLKRQRGRGVFQQRANIETALNFLKKKSVRLVNINIPDIIDGKPSIILGLVWTIILHCHIEELASTLSFSSRHSSLDSLASLDSWSGSPIPASPVPPGQTSPLHRRFRISAKKALLMWVRDQCQKVGCFVSVKDFKSSWRSGEAFLAILCSLRPQLVDLSLVQSRSNLENLEEAFHLAERKLHIARLLEPQDVDVDDPDEKSIMTYVAQFLQYSSDMPAPDEHLELFPLVQPPCFSPVNLPSHFTPAIAVSPLRQASPSERAREVTCWLQQAYDELSETWTAAEKSSYAEKYQVFQSLASSFTEQRRPVMTLFSAIRRCPELSQEQHALRTAWDRLEEELQRCKADLDVSLPPPLDSVAVWLKRAEAALTEEGETVKEHTDAAKEARAQQDTLQTLTKEMSHHVNIIDTFHNMDDSRNIIVPLEKFDEIKRRLTNVRVTAKYQGIKLEYKESRHTVLDLLGRISAKVQSWKAPYRSQETVILLLQDWHETVERQGLLLILMDALQKLKERANAYTSKAALDSQLVTRQVKEAESEAALVTQAVTTVRTMMERVVSAWETYDKCLTSLHTWLAQKTQSAAEGTQDMNEWSSCQARVNEVGNLLIEVTESSTSLVLAEQLSKLNKQWAEFMKKTMFEVSSEPVVGPLCLQMVHSLSHEASWLLRQPLEVASVPLKANRQKLQLLCKKLVEVDVSSVSPFPDKDSLKTLPEMLVKAERTCEELQRAASRLEGCLAELDHWSSEALDCYQLLKEKEHRGHSALESAAKGLISRGLQLENQVVTEGQMLQDLVGRVQKTSPLQHLSTSGMQDRISETVSNCQEILGMFSSLGFRPHVGEAPEKQPPLETAHQMQKQAQAGLLVVARTKHVDQVGNVKLQTQDPKQHSFQISSPTPQQRTRGLHGQPKNYTHSQSTKQSVIVVPHVKIQMLPQSVNKVESEAMIRSQSFFKFPAQASSSSQNEQPLTQTPVGPKSPKSPLLSKPTPSTVTEEKTGSSPSQTHKFQPKSRTREQPNTSQSSKTSLQPPVMVRSEVHSKAQSMAKSRLEKARFRLQGRIQQAIKLFGGKEISEAQAKKKQRALKILQPAFLEEFLVAVEGYGAFCSGPQLQDLILLSDSVRKQWEAITEGAQTIEERAESLQKLCETLAPRESSCLATDQLKESDEALETKPNDTGLLDDSRRRQLWENTPLRATGMPVGPQLSNNFQQKPSVGGSQQDLSAVGYAVSGQLHGDIIKLRARDVPTENEQHLTRIKDRARSGQEPSLQDKEQPLKARLLNITESSQQVQTHVQMVVRGDTVETKQEAEWTVIPETAVPLQEELSSEQEVLERMGSLENFADLMESADNQMTLITERLDRIIRDPVDISSMTLADPRLVSDLREMDDKLQSEMRKLSKQSAEEDRPGLETTSSSSLCQAFHSSVHHLEQLRQRLKKVHSAVWSLDHFLATTSEVEAEIPTLRANQDPSRQRNEADWEQERVSWQAVMQQRLQTAVEQSDSVDSILKAVGMTLTMDGATVTCRDVVTSFSQKVVEKELMRTRERESKEDKDNKLFLQGKEKMHEEEEKNSAEMCQTDIRDDSPLQGRAEKQEHPTPGVMEEESGLEAKRSRLEGENDTKTQGEEELKAQTWMFEGEVVKTKDQRRRRRSQVKTEKEEKESLVQRSIVLLGALNEIQGAAEQLGLQEPTLPALQQRTRALTRLESQLASHLSELQYMCGASSPSDDSQTRELEDLWKETTKAVTERLDQCCVLTELLKRFQSIRGELSGTLQRAENTISEQASYMGKDNLQRRHTQVQETKAELNGLGDGIEEVRCICRQLHTHLRQIPECTIIPFESEADALMDRWLDISERTDSHLENLHLGLTLWDGVLQLGAEVESWTANKLAVFAQSPSFQTDEDIRALKNEIMTREESMECFHRRATEIQVLLQSTEPPLELQVVETQMKKKMEQLKELVSEAEDFYRQMVATKVQITARMAECCSSLQRIQDSLLNLSGSDASKVLAKLKDLCLDLQSQDEQAESLIEDLQVMASIASPESLQSLSADGIQLQEKVRATHQIFSEVEEQTQRNIRDLDRLQRESEHLEEWLQATEEKAAKEEDLCLLQEEALQQRVRAEALSELVSSLQSSTLQQSALVKESSKLLERYYSFQTNVLGGCVEKDSSLRRDTEVFQAFLKSSQSRVEDLRQSPVEQKHHCAQAVENATVEGKAHHEEVGVTGSSLSPRLCDGDDLKQKFQENESELCSSYLLRRQEACCRVQELQHRTAQLPTLFPWPGTAERRQVCLLARQLQDEIESLQLTLISLDEQGQDQTGKTSDAIWKDSSQVELETCRSTLMAELNGVCSRLEESVCNEEHFGQLLQDCRHKLTSLQERMSACQARKEESYARQITDVAALEALLQEVTDVEKDLLQLVTLKDSVAASSTAEAQASLCQEVSNLQNHKRALDSSVRENLALLEEKRNQSMQKVKDEASCVQIALKDLAENLGKLSGNHEELPHISQLKQQWCIIQDCDNRLTVLAARVDDLQRTGESSITQEMLPADVILTVDAAAKDLDSLRSIFLQKKNECAENTANKVKQAISQLKQWSQTVQAEPSSPNQAALDEGSQLQQALHEVLSEGDFLLNCLGKKFTKKQKKHASDALSESTHALETLTKSLVSQVSQSQREGELEETVRSGGDTLHSASPDEKLTMCPPPSASDYRKNSDLNDNKVQIKGSSYISERHHPSTEPAMHTSGGSHVDANGTKFDQACISMQQTDSLTQTEDALAPYQVQFAEIPHISISKTQQQSQELTSTPPKTETDFFKTDLRPKDISTINVNDTECLVSESPLMLNKNLMAQQDNTEPLQKSPDIGNGVKLEDIPLPTHENQSGHVAAQSDTFRGINAAQELEKHCKAISVTPKRVFTVVLDMEPDELWYHKEAELVDAKYQNFNSSRLPKRKSGLFSTSVIPESDKTDFKSPCLDNLESSPSQVTDSMSETPPALVGTELNELKSTGAKSRCLENLETHDKTHNEVSNSSISRGSVAEFHVSGSDPAGTTFPHVKQEEMTDLCHPEERTMSPVLCTVKGSVQTGESLTETQIQLTAVDTAQSKGTGYAEMAEGEKTEEASDPDRTETKYLKVPERCESTVPNVESESKLPASLEAKEMTQEQPQIQQDMEPERTAQELAADPGAGEVTGGSPGSESSKHTSTMQDIFSEIQTLVERSNIINRTPHIDLNWYLKSSPGEPEIRLVRTVQKVLACRYQPAQLDITAMAKQLEEAQDYNRCVLEQVATVKNTSSAGVGDPGVLKSVEGQWSAALLDASATVQVKAAQLDQVKQYHKQMNITRAFLDVLAAENEKRSLNALGSSALQAEKLHALLQTMELKKDMMEELLRLSSQLSVHLSKAESSGALLAQLGDVQEEWRLLKGSIKRALQHASNSASQSALLIKEAEHLKEKLEALQKSNIFTQSAGKIHDSKSMLELICLTADLKLYNQLYLHLQSQSDALVHFSLGQKEKIEIKHNLQELWSLLNVTKSKLDTSTCSAGYVSSAKINNQLRDLIIWAKQAENHISIGKKLSLFPEEARIQIVEMKKCQTDILTRRSNMQVEVKEMKALASDMDNEECDQVLKTVEDLYRGIAESLNHVLDTMKKNLQEREKLLGQLASMDVWLAETHANRDPCAHIENVSKADTGKLESELKIHKLTTVEIERHLHLVEVMAESCKEVAGGLSPGESRYLVNRLSGLWTELDVLLAHEKATSWELEELIHERAASDEELSTIQASLKQISTDLEQLRFPLAQESFSTIALMKHMLMEHQCQVQDIQHCQEAKRSSLLCTIGELQDRCKALSIHAFEQDKYQHLRGQMEESRDIAKEQIQRAKDKTIRVGERFRLCQSLLVELPLVKTQCQEAADQLEAIAQELYPSQLNSERQRIHHTVETLVSWEHSVTDHIKNLEAKLLLGLRLSSELPALMELFQSTRLERQEAKPINPDEKAIDIALQRCWVIWRNMESGMRVFEALGQKEKINLKKNYKELYSLRDAAMKECHLQMESLSQARESLKDYQWAAQGAIGFLHNAEATFLSAPGGFLDCTEEQRQTQQALEALEDGFQAHICHLEELVPQQPCMLRPKIEQLHINILSQLLVGRAILEAQAQLRLQSLQRCEKRQKSHRSCHEDIRQRLSGFGAKISDCAAVQVTSYDKCVAQHERVKLLMEDLRSLAGKIEDLRAGCPMQGCGVGKGSELGALWSRWVSLRRGVGLLMAHTEQRGEEWRDITTTMEQCCSFLASLQADVPDSSTVSFTQEEPQELLAQAEMHQAGLEQEQQALASLEHQLEHALSLSSSQDPISPGPVGKTLVKIQENVRSLKERNLLVVAAAQAEEKERQQVQEEIGEVEQHIVAILPVLETCSNLRKQQELRKELSSQKAKLKYIMDGVQSHYDEIPADLGKRIQEVQLSLQRAEEKVLERSSLVQKLASQVVELVSGLEKVKAILEQRSTTFNESQNVLKHVWDELDAWHSRLMLLENEVQDLAEEQPNQAHLLMDQLTQPLQLYQNAAQMAEQRTAFLSKIPACLQEFEDILYSAICWLDEAQSWLNTPCSFTTARSLQNHAKALQLVLDDSVRIRGTLQDFRSVLAEISAVCDISTQEERLDQNDQQVHTMQRNVLEPLEQLLQAVVVVEAMEAELKTMEKNVPKIRTILSSMDNSSITLTEHLQNLQVILANVQSMQRTLEELEKCKPELHLPQGAMENLVVFSRARLLLQPLVELEQLTQQQTSLLENKIKEEEETSKDLGVTTTSNPPEDIQQPDGSTQRNFTQQEDFEVSNSEEEEDEEDESCHSSSSDTLTCSVPEDPEDTLNVTDVQSEDASDIKPLADIKALESLTGQFCSEVVTSSRSAESSSVEAWLDTKFGSENVETGLKTMENRLDPKAESGEVSRLKTVTETTEPLITAAASLDQHRPQNHETIVTEPHVQSHQAVEDTRLIPARPITPFTATRASVEFVEEEDGNLSSSTAPRQGLDTLSGLTEQSEVSTSHFSLVEESQHAQDSSEVPIRLAGHKKDDEEQQKWSRLHTQISQKLTTLKKVQEEHQTSISSEDGGNEKVPERELVSTGSASAVLQRVHEAIVMLRQIARSADGSHPDVKEEFYEAVRRVLLCLDALTDLLLTPGGAGEDDAQLRLLQQECVSSELVTLAGLLRNVESDTRPALLGEEPDALLCLTSVQQCLQTVQLVFTSSQNQLIEHLGLKNQHQELFSNQPCILDEFELGQSEMFPTLKEAPSLEQCVLGRHLREKPGEKAKLQQASQSLLQGITRLLELGEECITEGQKSRVHNRSQLQAVLCRHKKLLQVLGSQLAFVQHLFQREPEALKCQEDERVQLEVRAKALQQQALEQEVASQRRLQEWIRWEDSCVGLGRMLDELEAFISSGEPQGEDDEEVVVQHRLDACQQTLVQLDESRAAVGLLLDQGNMMQTEPVFAASVSQAGGALELRWRSAYRRTEQEIQRCRDVQDSRARFQTDFASVSDWLVGANKHLKSWSELANTSDLNQECVHSSLIKLLDFYIEMEAMSVQRAAVSKDATQLRHLREADCPRLRAQLAQLEVSWSQLTSDLSKIQDRLQQHLLSAWPPVQLLSDLEDWLKKLEARLSREKETVVKAKNAAQITESQQHYQELKAGMVSGQLLLDFLSQSGPRVVGADALCSKRTVFAEQLGALRLQWFHLHRELESQIYGAEEIHHTCAAKERQLQRLNKTIEQQKKQLNQWKQPTSQTLAHKALLEWEAVAGRVKEVAAALQDLKATCVHVEKEEEHACDVTFSGQAESLSHACQDLSKQMEALRPALHQTMEEWGCFERNLREVSLHTTRVRCSLQHHQAPLLSLKQTQAYMDLLQQHQEKARRGEELWVAVDKSYQSLMKTLDLGRAQSLRDKMEGERKRWKDMLQKIKDEHKKTGETLSLWQEYTRVSDNCSLNLQRLWHQWEELLSSLLSPQQDTQAMVHSVQKLQDAAEDLQSSVGDVLASSKPLIGHLEPLAANLIQSETRLLSRDVLLLNQAMSGKKKSLQEDLGQQKLFNSQLEALEKQTQNILHKQNVTINNIDSVKQDLLALSESLVDVREMSRCMSLSKEQTERLHMLSRQWIDSVTRTSDMNRELQAESQRSQDFQQKCKNLTSIQEKLEQESVPRKLQSYSNLKEMLTVHQRLQAEMIIGHQLLQGLLCDAVECMEKETGQKRSELMTQVACVKERWFSTVALAVQRRTLTKEQLSQWRIYHSGLKLLWKLLSDVDPLLPPAGHALCTLQQLLSCTDDYQCVEEALDLRSTVYNQTLDAGRHLCGTMTESECRSQLQSQLQAIEEAWKHTGSLLAKRRALINTTVQKWTQCQDEITNIMSELDELKTRLKKQLPKRPEDSEEETFIQKTDLSLQHLASELRELATMKTDMSQYVVAGDSALLEQQLEQLHGQWEELCTKVSLRRQEIADRLNAWTIFNDKNKEFCDWLTQMENKVCYSGDLSIEEMVEKLKKDCMEEINLFSENKSHLKQLGEQLLLASDEAKQTQVHGSLQEVNQRWHNLFNHIEARVRKLKETLVTMQQLDKNMSNLRSWLSRIEAELSRPITYSVCHHQEIQRRLAEQQELQRDIEQHTEGVASVLSLCDVLLRDEDAAGGIEAESDSLQETSRSLDQRWRTICAMALDRRLRIEETWRLWNKFLDDYSRFEDWLKMAERTAANPNSGDVLYTVAKEELKKFEGFQRQVHERLTQLELVNNQYRRLARENRTDRASQLRAMVHEGNRRWDTLHRRVAAILRRLKYFTNQREEFEGTRESMLVWLTELDLQLTNVEHFSESDVHHKIQQLNSFQKEITLNTERIDGLIVFGEGLIQKSSPQDAALIEDELEELHSYCQEVFSRLVRFHQRLSQPPAIAEEPELSSTTFSLESSLELIGRPWLGRSQGSLPATPTHLLTSPLERSGRETPVSVDSLPLEWDHTGDVGGSSSHEDDEEEEGQEEEGAYFSASEVELTESQEELVEASEALRASSLGASPRWRTPGDPETESHPEAPPTHTSTPQKGYLRLMSQCSDSIEDIKRVSLILDDEEQPEEFGLTGLSVSDKQSGVIERWELHQAQPRRDQHAGPQEPQKLTRDLDDIISWLENVILELDRLQRSDPAGSIDDMAARAKELKEMHKMFTRYKSVMLSVNLRAVEVPEQQERLAGMNRDWSRACTGLQQWDTSLRKTLMCCQEFHETLHSLLLWLAHAESRRYAVDINHPETPVRALQQHISTLTDLQEELRGRQAQQASLQALWSQLQPEEGAEESDEAREKLHVTGSKLKLLLRQVARDLSSLQQRLDCESASAVQGQSASADPSQEATHSKKDPSTEREGRDSPSPPRSFFYRVLRAAFPLHLLLLLLLLIPCLIPMSESDPGCTVTNNFAWSFYPMLRYTNGPPPT